MSRKIGGAASVALLSIGVASCQVPLAESTRTQPSTAFSPGWVGSVFLTADPSKFDTHKVFVMTYRFSGSAIIVEDSLLTYGPGSQLPSSANDYFVDLLAPGGRVLLSVGAGDPRRMIVEEEGNVLASSGILTVRLPYVADASAIRLRSNTDKPIVTTPLNDITTRFCGANRTDPDCARRGPAK